MKYNLQNYKLVFLTLLIMVFSFLWSWHHLCCQENSKVDILTTLLEEDRLEEISTRLPEVAKKFPHSPTVLYLQGVLESNARLAIDHFETLLQLHPDSQFADRAALRIAQYHYAHGSYITASQHLRAFINDYPNSKLCAHAAYHQSQCYLAQDRADSARTLLRQFIHDFPSSPLIGAAIMDLESLEKYEKKDTSFPEIQDVRQTKKKKTFTVQIGAFKDKENALSLAKTAMDMGYDVEGFRKEQGANRVYVVWVGSFALRSEAEEFARKFKAKHDINYIVVPKPD